MIVVSESRDIAGRLRHPLTTAHVLLCLFTVENHASLHLRGHAITPERLLEQISARPQEREDTWDRVVRRAEDVAEVNRSTTLTSLHVLVALCSFLDSAAYQLMARLQVDMAAIRVAALSWLRENRDVVPEPADSADTVLARQATRSDDRVRAMAPPPGAAPRSPDLPPATPATGLARAETPPEPESAPRATSPREPDDVRRRKRLRDQAERKTGRKPEAGSSASLAMRLFAQTPERDPNVPEPPAVRGPARARAPMDGATLPPNIVRGGASQTTGARPAADPPAARSPPPPPAPVRSVVSRATVTLRETEYPTLTRFGRNLTLLALEGRLDRVVGRDDEIDQLIDVLNKRRSNNPVLVGEPGVGKTAVVEGLARVMAGLDNHGAPTGLEGRILIELDSSRIVSGTGLRGSFSERLQLLKKEVAKAAGRVIVFLDELHHWIGMGGGADSAADGAGELKTALARGEFPCIGATTFDEYRRFIESDPAFERRFQQVRVEEPREDVAIAILSGIRPQYEAHHGVSFDDDALEAAVRLTHRYLTDQRLPDKAIGILDLAGSRARRRDVQRITREFIAALVAERAGLAPDKLVMADRERFLNLEAQLMTRIIGHQPVIERVAHVLRRNYAGFVSGRPIGSFLFLGPSGVGKTEFAKALSQVLFHDERSLLRFDMSEFMEAHAVSRLIGSPPGYVGHDAGGQLTEAVRRKPYQLVLLDEIEKAHPDVLNLLIQVLDDGRLTDSRGRTVDFSQCVIIMTSNLGAEQALGRGTSRAVGFGAAERTTPDHDITDRVRQAARGHFRPELWNRIDEPLVFLPLSRDEVARIARLQLARSSERLLAERRIGFTCATEVVEHLIDHGGYDAELGARPMRRTIERLVEAPVADLILRGTIAPPAWVEITVRDGNLRIEQAAAR